MDELPVLTEADLRGFTGDLDRYRHPLNRSVIYTPGVRFLAERGQAYWLIDAIVSHFRSPTMRKAVADDERLQWLQFWALDVQEDNSAVLTARSDCDVEPFVQQDIQYTDFPLAHVDIWAGFDSQYWTLYLPSEH